MTTATSQAAEQAVAAFAKALPPSTAADFIRVITDVAQGAKAVVNEAIYRNAPDVPLIHHFIETEMASIADATIDTFVANLSAAIQGAG